MKIAGYEYQSCFGSYIQQFLREKRKPDSFMSLKNGSSSTLMLFVFKEGSPSRFSVKSLLQNGGH